ncbi:membrane protein insertion efficiency factor YidD [Candidatus Daviesbacteria bacterium]|nr:membrane protein insertion efficiency factor YidD [Candidatus Daviesbacteria bacterium]
MKKITLVLIDFYRIFLSFDRGILSLLAPGGACKYAPTCSLYTKQMIEKYGVLNGVIKGLKRILSCR